MQQHAIPILASASIFLAFSACSNGGGGGSGGRVGPDATIPAQNVDFSLIRVHDPESEEYDDDCISCHGDLMNEYASDGVTPMAHSTMVRLHGGGNDRCIGCHAGGVDFLSGSAGEVRKQIDVEDSLCTVCHGKTVPGLPQFYVR